MTEPSTAFAGSWRRFALWLLVLLLLFAAGGIAWCIYVAASQSLHAEAALHATNEACELVTEYVRQNHGAWPRSWQDLELLSLPIDRFNVFPWPKDSQKLQQYVTIDFSADPALLAKQSVDDFEAIQPIGPCFSYKHDSYVPNLLNTLRKQLHRKHAP
jgi:hypothetical protein